MKSYFNSTRLALLTFLFSWGVGPAWGAPLTMKDVMESFLWAKIGTEFPAEILSESSHQIGFRVFDEPYSITRTQSGFQVQNTAEQTLLQSSTIEKIHLFVVAQKRSHASLNADQFKQSIRMESPESGYRWSHSLFQCSSDLPVKFRYSSGLVGKRLSHTWLQYGAYESFGMPFTDEGTYFGGSAHIRSPDTFIERKPKNMKCSPVWVKQDESQDEEVFSKKAACIARKMSLPQDPIFNESLISGRWVPHLDYHVFKRNCLKAVRFILECADAKAPLNVNWGIGGSFDWNEKALISEVGQTLRSSISKVRESLEVIRRLDSMENLDIRLNQLIDHANELDAEIRGQSGQDASTKSLREICHLIQESCDRTVVIKDSSADSAGS